MFNKKLVIHTKDAPPPRGTYSQAIKCGDTIYLAGQIPLNPTTQQLVADDLKAQITQVFANISAVTKAAGGTINDIVKLNIYLTDLKEFNVVNEVMAEFFTEPYPARTTIGISALPMGAKVEVEAIMSLT